MAYFPCIAQALSSVPRRHLTESTRVGAAFHPPETATTPNLPQLAGAANSHRPWVRALGRAAFSHGSRLGAERVVQNEYGPLPFHYLGYVVFGQKVKQAQRQVK